MSPATPKHKCPAPDCQIMVPRSQLACRVHWQVIPSEIRSRVWAGYRSNDALKHTQAMRDAESFLEAQAVAKQTVSGQGG